MVETTTVNRTLRKYSYQYASASFSCFFFLSNTKKHQTLQEIDLFFIQFDKNDDSVFNVKEINLFIYSKSSVYYRRINQ